MKSKKGSESGQALVLIVLIIFGLFGMTALAIDGSNVFVDRRQAQNAADNAALTAAMKYAQNPYLTTNDLAALAISSAANNGYTGIAPRSIVTLKFLPKDLTDCPLAPSGDIF